jgi:hypothetical protein
VRFTLAATLLGLAQLELDQQAGAASAAPLLDEGIEMLEKLAGEFPQTVAYRRTLAESLTRQGRSHFAAEKLEPAAASALRAQELLGQLSNDAHGAIEYEPHLAAASLLAGELELKRGSPAAARTLLIAARDHFARARAVNQSNEQLADDERVPELSALGIDRRRAHHCLG